MSKVRLLKVLVDMDVGYFTPHILMWQREGSFYSVMTLDSKLSHPEDEGENGVFLYFLKPVTNA